MNKRDTSTSPDGLLKPAGAGPSEFGSVALVLQGGGALGAYQAGVYERLLESDIEPNWLSGISIGAINSAIIAGNARHDRVARLREFWELVSDGGACAPGANWSGVALADTARAWVNQLLSLIHISEPTRQAEIS